jgi:hypothetical protein
MAQDGLSVQLAACSDWELVFCLHAKTKVHADDTLLAVCVMLMSPAGRRRAPCGCLTAPGASCGTPTATC